MTLPSSESERSVDHKAPRIRSSAYPAYTLEFCVEFTRKFHQNFGGSSHTLREHAAKVLGISVGHIQSQLSAAVQYGLCELKPKVGYKSTGLFIRVYRPMDDAEKQDALIDCLCKPELYSRLISEYNGQELPSLAGLSTILFRKHKIAEAASRAAAKTFFDNLNWLGLIVDGKLKIERDLGEETVVETIQETHRPTTLNQLVQQRREADRENKASIAIMEQPQTYPIPVPLKGGRVATLIVPEGYTNEDLDKIVRFIDALRE